MKFASLIFVLTFSIVAEAQMVSVKPMYDANSRVPMALIPFRVQGDAILSGKIDGIKVTRSNQSADCRAMKDPYLKDVFLLKCTQVTDVMMKVTVVSGSTRYVLNYGPIAVKLPAAGLTVVEPGPTDPNILAGRQLFNTYCVECHSQAKAKSGRTNVQIKNAVFAISDMFPLKTVLSDTDYIKLSAYLKSL